MLMKSGFSISSELRRWWVILATLLPLSSQAFPPAPPHTLYGVVRDQIGNPLDLGGEVIFESASGVKITTFVAARTEPAINYQLEIPMDAGLTADAYLPTALRPTAPFLLRVRIGKSTYLPIEMTGDLNKLGLPGGRTRIDLTLGIDADGNGLPDAWEKAVAALLGRPWIAGQIRPEDFYPGSGMSYREVYVAGTYAVEPKDGFTLQILSPAGESPRLEFTVVKGRSYTVQAASTIGHWSDVSFRVLSAGSNAPEQWTYQAAQTQRVQIEASSSVGAPVRFFRLIVQ